MTCVETAVHFTEMSAIVGIVSCTSVPIRLYVSSRDKTLQS
jgi:hypothetical protein